MPANTWTSHAHLREGEPQSDADIVAAIEALLPTNIVVGTPESIYDVTWTNNS